MSALHHKRCCDVEGMARARRRTPSDEHVCIWCHEEWPCTVARIRHELAVQIRAYKITPSGHPSYDDGKDAGLDLAADLIDPETT